MKIINVTCKFIICLIVCQSCQQNRVRSIVVNHDLKAVGEITTDTVYNGLIRFYNIKTSKLVSQYNYFKGLRNGDAEEYYYNGKLAAKLSFYNDLLNNFVTFYDKDGNIIAKQFYYYGLRVGPVINFENNDIESYKYYSFENNLLLNLDYKKLKTERITENTTGFFFYHKRKFSEFVSDSLSTSKEEYFLYTPNPPNYKFLYSLVVIDSTYKVLVELKDFDENNQWVTFEAPKLENNHVLALRLKITDTLKGNIRMFKILNNDNSNL